jgi:hypothetical protein
MCVRRGYRGDSCSSKYQRFSNERLRSNLRSAGHLTNCLLLCDRCRSLYPLPKGAGSTGEHHGRYTFQSLKQGVCCVCCTTGLLRSSDQRTVHKLRLKSYLSHMIGQISVTTRNTFLRHLSLNPVRLFRKRKIPAFDSPSPSSSIVSSSLSVLFYKSRNLASYCL